MESTDDPATDRHHQQDPPPPAPQEHARRLPLAGVAILLGFSLNLGLCIRRARDDLGAAAFVAFSHLNLFALVAAIRRFEDTPDGSAARGRARVAVWLATTTLTAAFTWRVGAMLPLGLAVAAWVLAAVTVLAGFYMMFLPGGDDK
ncbi:hypothetical protein HU200_035798 [Digitaria exilis]|uniref:Uncharacterized protein n=1 Tax=Digitaria exilis TaxID=1010633 RepID=A0A835BHR8_9POAL|nr:hypothetical protein HU200_035798 [Digitaria exilis]CAB3466993.1 unnamed protein product [Digitaria exilis]